MNEKHLEECLTRLDDTKMVLDNIATDLRGAQEFRDAVFDLLEGTPFGALADSTYDGLYGRLRAALAAAPVLPGPPTRPDGWLEGEIELTAFALAHPDCDVRAVLRGFAAFVQPSGVPGPAPTPEATNKETK